MVEQLDWKRKKAIVESFVIVAENRGLYVPLEVQERIINQPWEKEETMRIALNLQLYEIEKELEEVRKEYRRRGEEFPSSVGYIEISEIQRRGRKVVGIELRVEPYAWSRTVFSTIRKELEKMEEELQKALALGIDLESYF